MLASKTFLVKQLNIKTIISRSCNKVTIEKRILLMSSDLWSCLYLHYLRRPYLLPIYDDVLGKERIAKSLSILLI